MHEAEVIVLEGALAFGGLRRCWLGATVQPFGLEDAPDAVAVEMRQEVRNDKRQVIEGEVGDPAQRADNGAPPRLPSRAPDAAAPRGPGNLPHPACATCGWSRWTRHSAGRGCRCAPGSRRSRHG